MRLIARLLQAALLLSLAACTKDSPKGDAPPPGAAPAKPAAAPGTDGGGDGSGSSMANARAVRPGAAVAFTLDCKASMYFGPFRFTKDPEKLSLVSTAKSPRGEQVCIAGDWLDKTGAHVGGAAIGCVDGPHTADGTAVYEYSPGNGGAGANPVYLRTSFGEPKPSGCPSIELTLKL